MLIYNLVLMLWRQAFSKTREGWLEQYFIRDEPSPPRGASTNNGLYSSDDDEDINHNPVYDPPGISEEIEYHECLRIRALASTGAALV